MWCATMSCISRAMRWRSSSRARSPSCCLACSASSTRLLRRERMYAPASSGMAASSAPTAVRASMKSAPITVTTAVQITNQVLQRTATAYRQST